MMDESRIHAAARKALMAADENYYSWPAQQRERFRATMDDAAQCLVEAVLLKELMGIRCTAKDAGEIWRDVPLTELNALNWAKLLTTGIGDDWLFLNEGMAENTSLLDFETLYDYDHADHLFQEQANKQEFKDYKARDYYALRWPSWVRLIIDDRFYYATFNSLAGYLVDAIDCNSNEWINTLIPHDYFEGKVHGKPVQGGFNWDMRTNAAGLEGQLDELKNRWHEFMQRRWLEWSHEFTRHAPAVYMNDTHRDGELHRDFIFTNENTLKCIRWQHFLMDCESLLVDMASVTQRMEQETTHAKLWLQETHADIMKNFDPTVVKLKKKRKIVIAPGAFDSLVSEGEESE